MRTDEPMYSKIAKERFFNFIIRTNIFKETQYENLSFSEVSAIVIDKISEIIPSYGMRKALVILTESVDEIEFFTEKGYEVTAITTNINLTNVNDKILLLDESFTSFPDKSFDVIWSKHSLNKSISAVFTLTEYFRMLKNDGLLYLELISDENFLNKTNIENNFSLYRKEIWKLLIENTGFNVIDTIDLSLAGKEPGVKNLYWMFFCNKFKSTNLTDNEKEESYNLYLALSKGENFGWGVCSKYLKNEVAKLYKNVYEWDFEREGDKSTNVKGKVFHALTGIEFESISKLRGSENYGYTFFENEILPISIENSKKYDIVIGGSTWCKEKMLEKGITNVDVLIQGIDPDIFYPVENRQNEDVFVIFSGGKFELRKGQDSVIKAISILQKKYSNIILLNVWYNMWPQTMELMYHSPHIKFERFGNSWTEQINHILAINDVDITKVATYEIVPNTQLRDLYALTDIGVFPNRCEGGTNLVLMEYMACARPVIASYTSGHKDILTDENSIPLKLTKPFRLYDNNNKLWADWEDISIDELVDKLEFAYHNREAIRKIGQKAGEDLKNFTWHNSGKELLRIVGL